MFTNITPFLCLSRFTQCNNNKNGNNNNGCTHLSQCSRNLLYFQGGRVAYLTDILILRYGPIIICNICPSGQKVELLICAVLHNRGLFQLNLLRNTVSITSLWTENIWKQRIVRKCGANTNHLSSYTRTMNSKLHEWKLFHRRPKINARWEWQPEILARPTRRIFRS